MGTLSLEIVEGLDTGQRVELAEPVRIGRAADVGLRLTDPLVSRAHAVVAADGPGAVVTDLGSSNGTFVNGDQVHGSARLDLGDHLVLGSTVIELRSAEQVARRPSAAIPVPPPLAAPASRPDYVPADVAESLDTAERAEAGPSGHALDPLLDARVKRKARAAPLAVFVLVVLVVLIWLATR